MSNAATETRSVVVEREVPFPPEKLWRALTQPHLIEEWLMKNDFKPLVGHRFNLRGDWGGVLDCEVLAVEPNKTLSYTWNFTHDDAAYNLKSVVTFTLTKTSTGTHLRMEQSGFRPDQKQAYGGANAGWQQFFAKLEQILARTEGSAALRFGSYSEGDSMNWNNWVRQIHRWLSIAFTATVIANFAAMGLGEPPAWVVYTPLLPLFLLLFTGLYMFVLPYAAGWRSARGADG
jgi:uncharacterized protein YndB with AHSA1/START domain